MTPKGNKSGAEFRSPVAADSSRGPLTSTRDRVAFAGFTLACSNLRLLETAGPSSPAAPAVAPGSPTPQRAARSQAWAFAARGERSGGSGRPRGNRQARGSVRLRRPLVLSGLLTPLCLGGTQILTPVSWDCWARTPQFTQSLVKLNLGFLKIVSREAKAL